MTHFLSLNEFVDLCGGLTNAALPMNTNAQTLFNAIKANRKILVKLDNKNHYLTAYEIKPFPNKRLN